MSSSLQLAAIHLRVAELTRSVEFYVRRLGFVLRSQGEVQAELGTESGSSPILTLSQVSAAHAAPAPRDTAGLFHAALLLPNRSALGTWLQSTAAHGIDFEGFSDHGVSEAVYLSDPDGNGLEFYADRPRSAWPFSHGELAMTTRPLAVRSLLGEAAAPSDTPLAGSHWGHLHLRVTDLERSEAFYREQLGVEVMQRSYPGARFLASDGYHHHLGLNTWGGTRLPQPPRAVGLAEATFIRNGTTTETSLTDPDGIHVRVLPALVPSEMARVA